MMIHNIKAYLFTYYFAFNLYWASCSLLRDVFAGCHHHAA